MQERYALRFESGERRGEIIAIRAGGLTLGRRPGNSVQILDASVSGRHAEVVVDERGALLRDLGSTNGTRVGAERIAEQRLAHGDAVSVGTVRFLFIDRSVGGEPPPLELEGDVPVAAAAGAAAAGDAVHTISADKLARAKNKRSVLVGAVALVVAVGAAAGWFLWPRATANAGNKSRAVEAVAGNLLANGYSFEDDAGWEAFPEAPARFLADPAAARSGKQGLRASLASGEWALERSAEVAIKSRGLLKATAWIAAEGDVAVQLGIELSSSNAAAGTTWAWTAPAPTGSGFQEVALAAPVLPGFDRVRVLVLARGGAAGGLAQLDDASLVAAGNAPEPAAKIGEFQLALLGDPGRAAVLSKIDHPLITDLRVAAGEDPYGEHAPNVTVEPQDTGARLRFAANGGERALSLRVEPGPTAQGIATLGEGGYRTHQVEFTREGVTSLLAGSGIDLVRIVFPQPVTVSGRPEDNGFRLRAGPGGVDELLVQVVFRDERAAGEDLARSARNAEKEGHLGESLAHWKELLDRSPFENALIQEAEGARSRLIQKGLEEVAASKNEVERAQFFRLADLYRECRTRADAIAGRYQGSEVETAARELVARIDAELAVLEVDLKHAERERLRRILAVLEQGKMDQLATRVRDELAKAGGGAN